MLSTASTRTWWPATMNGNRASFCRTRGLSRNRLKIGAAVTNAQAFLRVDEGARGRFDRYIWRFVGGLPRVNHWRAGEGRFRARDAGVGSHEP